MRTKSIDANLMAQIFEQELINPLSSLADGCNRGSISPSNISAKPDRAALIVRDNPGVSNRDGELRPPLTCKQIRFP